MKTTYKSLEAKLEKLKKLQSSLNKPNDSLENWYDVELTHSSNAIEGNSLTRIETAEVMEKGIHANISDKPLKNLIRIGELSQKTGETIHTLHFWIKEGLLTSKNRTAGGYQLFDENVIDKIKEIRNLQKIQRLTLSEIKLKLG